jgi:hypothetical protein
MWMIAVCCTRRASICDARDNSFEIFMAAAPAWRAEVSLSVRIGAAGERRPPGASAACHLTPSCFETQVRATDEQHLLWPAFETMAKRARELSARENLQTESCSVGHEVAPSLVLQSSMPVSVSVICPLPMYSSSIFDCLFCWEYPHRRGCLRTPLDSVGLVSMIFNG